MPIIFPFTDQVLADKAWQEDLKSDKFGDPDLAGRIQLIEYFSRAQEWATKSKTAKAILATVQYTKGFDIFFVGMQRGGYSCFNSDCPTKYEHLAPGQNRQGTVYFNLDIVLKVKVRDGVDTRTMVPAKDWKTQKPVKDGTQRPSREPQWKDDMLDVDPFIAFFHELGHAKQFIENPDFFERRRYVPKAEREKARAEGKPAPVGEKLLLDPVQISTAARHWAAGLTKETRETLATSGMHFSSRRPAAPAPSRFVSGAPRPTFVKARLPEYLALTELRLTKPTWDVRIESDNLLRHEWPICRELGWKEEHLRHYTDIKEL